MASAITTPSRGLEPPRPARLGDLERLPVPVGARARGAGRGLPPDPARARDAAPRAVRARPHDPPGRAHVGSPARDHALAIRPPGPLSLEGVRCRCRHRRKRWRFTTPGVVGAFFVGPNEGGRREDEARVHLAGRLRADSEPALEDEDRRVRRRADARGRAGVELRRQLDAPGGRLELGLLPAAGRALPRPGPRERDARDVRGAAPGRDAASVEQPRLDPRRPGRVVRLRAGVLPVQGRPPARLPRRRLPGAAGRVLHGRRLQERRRRRTRDRRHAHRPLPGRGDQPRGRQRRGGEEPVGVPDLRQGLAPCRRRGLDRALPAPAPVRAVRHRHQLPSEAARRRARLERLGHALQLLDEAHAGSRRRGRTSQR